MSEQASGAAPRENALVDYLSRLGKHKTGRLAAHIHISRLSRVYMRAHYLDLAMDIFGAAIRTIEGRLFRLHNNDLIFVATSASRDVMDRAVDRLRALFGEDPIFAYPNAAPFCDWYQLEDDYDTLMNRATEWREDREQARIDYARPDPAAKLVPIGPELLARVERALETADFTNLTRRQMVCTVVKDMRPLPVFEEIYVSIFDLQSLVTPGVNWLADQWLFQYITRRLDKRVMAMLIRHGPQGTLPFSINLNIASVLSPEFRRFDEIVRPQVRGRLVIEFNNLDVFVDLGAFLFARDYLHERGYRLCLDGLSHLTLPYYQRARLGFDLVKLRWRPDGVEDMPADSIPSLRDRVKEIGLARTILCRCENVKAIEIGQQLGIMMFQGRYVDRMFNQAGKVG